MICGNANALGMNGSSANGIFSAGFTLKSGTLDLNGWGNYANTNSGVGTNYLFYGVYITFEGSPGATMNFIDSTPGHPGFGVAPSASTTVITYNGVNNPGKAVIGAPWYAVGTGAYPRTYAVQVDPTTASPFGLEFQGQMSSLSYEGKLATIQKTGDGFSYGYGKDLLASLDPVDVVVYVGFNTGRMRIYAYKEIRQKNPFFSLRSEPTLNLRLP